MQPLEKLKSGQSWEEKLSHFIPRKKYKRNIEKLMDFVFGVLGTLFISLIIFLTPVGDILNKLGLGPNTEALNKALEEGERTGGVWIFFWWFISIALSLSLWKLRKYISLGIMTFWIVVTFLLVVMLILGYLNII